MAAPRPVFSTKLAEFFASLRKKKNWNQSQAAEFARRRHIPLSYQALRGLEDGKTKNPDPDILRAVARLYGTTYEAIVAEVIEARYGVRSSGGLTTASNVAEGPDRRLPAVLTDEQQAWLDEFDALEEHPTAREVLLTTARLLRVRDPEQRAADEVEAEAPSAGHDRARGSRGRSRRGQTA